MWKSYQAVIIYSQLFHRLSLLCVFVMLVFTANRFANYRKVSHERRPSAWEPAIAFHTFSRNKEWANPPITDLQNTQDRQLAVSLP